MKKIEDWEALYDVMTFGFLCLLSSQGSWDCEWQSTGGTLVHSTVSLLAFDAVEIPLSFVVSYLIDLYDTDLNDALPPHHDFHVTYVSTCTR